MVNVQKSITKSERKNTKKGGGSGGWNPVRRGRSKVKYKFIDLEDKENPFSKRFRKAVADANFERYKQKLPLLKLVMEKDL